MFNPTDTPHPGSHNDPKPQPATYKPNGSAAGHRTTVSVSPAERALGAIQFFHDPDDIVEIRALNVDATADWPGKIYAGYFEVKAKEEICEEIERLDGRAEGIYFVLNKVNPALLTRSKNRLQAKLKNTTKDSDIVERQWLYIDVDANRPAGISSSELEHKAALAVADRIRAFLSESDWPEPLYGDSGNGAHLHYKLPELESGLADDLVRRCLQALAARFSDEHAAVDTGTFNRARICKLYGTMARKGDPTPERPHRRAKILNRPKRAELKPVTLECLTTLAEEVPTASAAAAGAVTSAEKFDIDSWLARSGLALKGPKPYNGGRKWILHCCPFNPDHVGTSAAVFELASGALAFKCLHEGCKGKDWKALRGLIEPNRHTVANTTAAEPRIRRIEDVPWIGDVASAKINWIVKGVLAAGTITSFMGDWGSGKSSLADHIVYYAALGLPVLGHPTMQRHVLVLDAENPAVSVMDRIQRLGIKKDKYFHMWGQWVGEEPPEPAAGIVLEWVARTEPKPILVFDSFAGFLEGDENNAADVEKHMKQYRALTALGATVILLHNTNRQGTYRGSSRILDAVDVAYSLTSMGGDRSKLGLIELNAEKQRISVEPKLWIRYRGGQFYREDPDDPDAVVDPLKDLLIGHRHQGISTTDFYKVAMKAGFTRAQAADFLKHELVQTVDRGKHHYAHYWKWLPTEEEI
jgi:archaellum biogenesis ATPase FlaH